MIRNINSIFKFATRSRRLILFGGQGTHEKGMLNEILKIPQAKTELDELSHNFGKDLQEISTTDVNKVINQTQVTQPLLVATHYLYSKYKFNIQPLEQTDTLIGHSVGQYSALVLAGSIGIQECLKLVEERGRLMSKHSHSSGSKSLAMLIIRFNEEQGTKIMHALETRKGEKVYLACHNSPLNIIVAGDKESLEGLRGELRKQKISSLFLPVSTAFHCPLLQPMKEQFSHYLNTITFKPPKSQILRNIDGKRYVGDDDIKQGLVEHLTTPVQFWQSVKKWREHKQGETQIIQIGHKEFVKKFAIETLAFLSSN